MAASSGCSSDSSEHERFTLQARGSGASLNFAPFEAPPMSDSRSPPPQPQSIVAHQRSRVLEIGFDDGAGFQIPFELMRVYSPSAEVQGHGPGQETLQVGKRAVDLVGLEPVGHYAVKPVFSDGHETGIFTWDYLYFLGSEQAELWRRYEARLHAAGASRDPPPAHGGTASVVVESSGSSS